MTYLTQEYEYIPKLFHAKYFFCISEHVVIHDAPPADRSYAPTLLIPCVISTKYSFQEEGGLFRVSLLASILSLLSECFACTCLLLYLLACLLGFY